jgi:phosphoglycolate phosphatase
MLQTLYEHKVKMGVATNAPTLFAKTMLQHLHVSDFFEEIVGADQVKVSKPDPEMLYKILDACDYDASCDYGWMVGDNSKDMQSGVAAGLEPIFVTWGFSKESEEFDYVSTPEELVKKVLSGKTDV